MDKNCGSIMYFLFLLSIQSLPVHLLKRQFDSELMDLLSDSSLMDGFTVNTFNKSCQTTTINGKTTKKCSEGGKPIKDITENKVSNTKVCKTSNVNGVQKSRCLVNGKPVDPKNGNNNSRSCVVSSINGVVTKKCS